MTSRKSWSCVVAMSCIARVAVAAEPITDDVRRAATASLPYLEREGLRWMREKACVTCHQIPVMVWAFNAADRADLRVDDAQVGRWNAWALDNSLKRATYYKLTDAARTKLVEAKLPEAVVAKLEPLKDKNYVFVDEFRDAASVALGKEASPYEAALLAACATSGQGGGGGGANNQYVALLTAGVDRAVAEPEEARRELTAALVKTQAADGSWAAAAQFKSQQRPVDEAIEVCTQWAVFALAANPTPTPAAHEALSRARGRLELHDAAMSVEHLMLRAMLARHAGDETTAARLTDELLKLQHADGGWGWLKDRAESDPFTTGEVLYGLSYLGRDGRDPAIRKAWRYLLNRQDADGKWPLAANTISASKKADRKDGDYIYTYWTTGWAVVGMLSTLPE